MTVDEAARLDEGNRRERAIRDFLVKIRDILDVRRTDRGIGHDRRVVLERIANIAVLVGVRADRAVVQLIGVADVVVPLVPEILPRNVGADEAVSDAGRRRRWNREHGILGIGIVYALSPLPK